jgi:hypothetical protein
MTTIEMNGAKQTEVQADSDEEEEIFNMKLETQGMISGKRNTKKKRPWFKYGLIVCAIGLISVMVVQLLQQYGDWIEVRVFPPRVTAAAELCINNTKSLYQMQVYSVTAINNKHIYRLNTTKPEIDLTITDPSADKIEWEEDSIILTVASSCVKIIVYSV